MLSYYYHCSKDLILASKDIYFWERYNNSSLISTHRYNAWWLINGWKENRYVSLQETLDFIFKISNQYIYIDNIGKIDALQYAFFVEWERIYKNFSLDDKESLNKYDNQFVEILKNEVNSDFAAVYSESKMKYLKSRINQELNIGILGDFSSFTGISEDAKLLYENLSKYENDHFDESTVHNYVAHWILSQQV